MFGNFQVERERSKMRDFTKEFDWGFRIRVFELSVCRTHAAKGLNAAARALGFASSLGIANLRQTRVPTVCKGSPTKIVAILVREHTDGHSAAGVYRAAVLSAPAGVLTGG